MRRLLIAVLIFMCVFGMAWAEDNNSFVLGELYSSDLDGDGTEENWFFEETEDDNGCPVVRLTVEPQGENSAVAAFDIEAWAWGKPIYYSTDMNDDGIKEIIVSAITGEAGGHTTYCLNYAYGRIWEVLFPEREAYSNGYALSFPGYVHSIDGNVITLITDMKVLGSWKGIWRFSMGDKGRMEFCGDGWYERFFDTEESSMQDYWDWSGLTLAVETAYRDGDQIGMLYPGDRILITGTDFENEAGFIAEDGRSGILYISSKESEAHGWFVNCHTSEDLADSAGYRRNLIDEEAYFSSVPYAG